MHVTSQSELDIGGRETCCLPGHYGRSAGSDQVTSSPTLCPVWVIAKERQIPISVRAADSPELTSIESTKLNGLKGRSIDTALILDHADKAGNGNPGNRSAKKK